MADRSAWPAAAARSVPGRSALGSRAGTARAVADAGRSGAGSRPTAALWRRRSMARRRGRAASGAALLAERDLRARSHAERAARLLPRCAAGPGAGARAPCRDRRWAPARGPAGAVDGGTRTPDRRLAGATGVQGAAVPGAGRLACSSRHFQHPGGSAAATCCSCLLDPEAAGAGRPPRRRWRSMCRPAQRTAALAGAADRAARPAAACRPLPARGPVPRRRAADRTGPRGRRRPRDPAPPRTSR
jgi:hypothetical protein